jgi:hypothetical protein
LFKVAVTCEASWRRNNEKEICVGVPASHPSRAQSPITSA